MTRDELKQEVWDVIVSVEGGPGYHGRLQDAITDLVQKKAQHCADLAYHLWCVGEERFTAFKIKQEFGLD
jgi:hypothetical protein